MIIISHRKKKSPDEDELTFEEMCRNNRLHVYLLYFIFIRGKIITMIFFRMKFFF